MPNRVRNGKEKKIKNAMLMFSVFLNTFCVMQDELHTFVLVAVMLVAVAHLDRD